MMRLYFPVVLIGNVNMIEKLMSDGSGTGGPPDFQPEPETPTSEPSSHAYDIHVQ